MNLGPVGLVHVAWEPGGPLDPESLTSYLVSPSDVSHAVTDIACGARHVTISAIARAGGAKEMNRRIAATFRCRPDPAQEQHLDETPVVFDLGPGWFLLPPQPRQIQLTDGKHLALAQINAGLNLQAADAFLSLPDAVPGMKISARQGDHWPVTMNVDATSYRGAIQVLWCPDQRIAVLLAWFTTGADVDAATSALQKARCRRPFEPPQVWPDLPREAATGAPAP